MAVSKNQGLMYGVICGLVSIFVTVILYLIGVKAFMGPLSFLGFAIPIAIGVLAGLARKKAQGGFLEFREALQTAFLVMVIGTVISVLFNYVLLNYIDVPFREALAQETAETQARWMQKFNAPQDQIDKAVADTLNGNNYTLAKMLLSAAFISIFWFLMSLIVAAIIKKKKPVFE